MRTAPLTAAARRRPAHWMFGVPSRLPAASLPSPGPGDPIGLTVELLLGGVWTDVSAYVYYRGGGRVRNSRGRPNETSAIQPQTCTFTINNRDGRFSPRNPAGPYYGLLGRNTPIRVSRIQNGVRRYRFYGEVPSWPTTWDISGTDVYATISAAGQMRRLFQGNQPLHSAMYRGYILGLGGTFPSVAYWPCEDGQNSTSIASGLPGGTPMALSGQALPTFASNTSFPSSLPLPLCSGSIWTGTIPAYGGGDSNALKFLVSIPSTGAFDTAVMVRMYTLGTVAQLDVAYSASLGGSLTLTGYGATGAQLFALGPAIIDPAAFNGTPIMAGITVTPVGGSIFYELEVAPLVPGGDASQFTSIGIVGTTLVGASVGHATSVVVNPDGHLNDTAIGHVAYQAFFNDIGNLAPAFNAWISESVVPADHYGTNLNPVPGRFLRLCQEQGVPGAVIAATGVNAGDPTTMGYQLDDTFTNLIQEPAASNSGMLFEARDQGSLILRERGTLYNQPARLTLDYSQNQLSGPLNPVDDDALTRNDVTATRVGGSSSQQILSSGTLSVQPPPLGVGDYPTTYNLSLGSDTLLPDQAGWRLHLGTVDQPRYPSVMINLRHPTFTGNLDMMNAALGVDIGDRVVITNPPPWMPPDPISLIVQGYSETLGIWEHDIVFNCSPESPYRVGILDDAVLGRADTDGSTLALPAGATDTAMYVATTGSGSPLWTANAADFPFDVGVGGERVTVTSVAPQLGVDGTFETGVSGWTTASATLSSSSTAHAGSHSGLMTATAVTRIKAFTPSMPVVGGASYTYSQWTLLGSGTFSTGFGVILWFDTNNSQISQASTVNAAPSALWTNQAATVTAPALAAFAQIGPQADAGGIGSSFFVDDVTFTQTGGPQLFTVTRSVNGVVKTQTAGTDVRLWQPMYLSL